MAHDLVIRGGRVVDGTGAEPAPPTSPSTTADRRGRRRRRRPAPTEIDANGALVTPGWVDVHSHYDGQATWDQVLAPAPGTASPRSSSATAASASRRSQPDAHDWLIDLMEGVEDIPGTALWPRASPGSGRASPSTSTSLERRRVDDRHRHPDRPRRGARLRDGRARGPQRAGHRRRHRRDGSDRAGGDRGRRPRASPPAARSPTAPSTASRCPAPTPPTTSCSASAPCSASSAPACSSWRRPAPPARTSSPRWSRWRWMRKLAEADPSPGHLRHAPGRLGARSSGGRCSTSRPPRWPTRRADSSPRWPAAPPACCRASTPPTRFIDGARPTRRSLAPPPRRWRTCAPPRVAARSLGWEPDAAIGRQLAHAAERTYLFGDPPDYEPGPEATSAGGRRGVGPVGHRGGARRHAGRRRSGPARTCRSSTTATATPTPPAR